MNHCSFAYSSIFTHLDSLTRIFKNMNLSTTPLAWGPNKSYFSVFKTRMFGEIWEVVISKNLRITRFNNFGNTDWRKYLFQFTYYFFCIRWQQYIITVLSTTTQQAGHYLFSAYIRLIYRWQPNPFSVTACTSPCPDDQHHLVFKLFDVRVLK